MEGCTRENERRGIEMAANNGFKIVQFSPELIQALTQMGELRTRINDYAVEEFKNYKGEENWITGISWR